MVGKRKKTVRDQQNFLKKLKELDTFDSWPEAKKVKALKRCPEGIDALRLRMYLNFLAQEGDPEKAKAWYKENQDKKFNVVHYCSLLRIISEGPASNQDFFKMLLSKSLKLQTKNEVMYSLATRGYSNWDDYKSAIKWLNMMKESSYQPRYRTYSPIVLSIARNCTLQDLHILQKYYYEMRTTLIKLDLQISAPEYCELLQGLYRLKKKAISKSKKAYSELLDFIMETLCNLCSTDFIPCKELSSIIIKLFPRQEFKVRPDQFIKNDGYCPCCKTQLLQRKLTKKEIESLRDKVDESVRAQTDKSLDWDIYKEWLNTRLAKLGPTRGRIDIVIDAANVAYHKQNFRGSKFSFSSISTAEKELSKLGFNCVLVLHKSHTNKKECHTREDRATLQEWRDEKKLIVVEPGNNDDWYWLYTSLSNETPALILSNDEMRDHHFMILRQKTFQTWKKNHQIFFDSWNNDGRKTFKFTFPWRFTYTTQIKFRSGQNISTETYGRYRTKGKRKRSSQRKDSQGFTLSTLRGPFSYTSGQSVKYLHIPLYKDKRPDDIMPGHRAKYTARPPSALALKWICIRKRSKKKV